MSVSTSSKNNKTKPKTDRNRSEEQYQQTQIINQSLTTVDPNLQLGNSYGEQFPPLGALTLSPASRSSQQSFEVGFIVPLSDC